jgi:hypothetical protein
MCYFTLWEEFKSQMFGKRSKKNKSYLNLRGFKWVENLLLNNQEFYNL